MAVTTETYSAAAGWERGDIINLLESGFAYAGLHGPAIAGITSTVKTNFGGGTVGAAYTAYFDCPVATTTGIGTGLTLNVYRSNGTIPGSGYVKVNKPGYNFAENDQVTIDPEYTGGTQNSATTLTAIVGVMGQGSPENFGTTSTFFKKRTETDFDSNRPYGVLRQVFDQGKVFGTTYRGFKISDDYRMGVSVGPSFGPNEDDQTTNYGMYGESFRGAYGLDVEDTYGDRLDTEASNWSQVRSGQNFRYASSSSPKSHSCHLNVYRSSIDTNFAVFSWQQPSIDGTLTDSTFSTFIIHNFNHSLYDYDECFSAGMTFITPGQTQDSSNASSVCMSFTTMLCGNRHTSGYHNATRTCESGWAQIYSTSKYGAPAVTTTYTPTSGENIDSAQWSSSFYTTGASYNDTRIFTRTGSIKDYGRTESVSSSPNYYRGNNNPITERKNVIKGIPINAGMVPCPYYIPDDFCLIDLKLDQSEQNIRQGDTITVSGSEVYKVITGAYNKNQETNGIFFCARVV